LIYALPCVIFIVDLSINNLGKNVSVDVDVELFDSQAIQLYFSKFDFLISNPFLEIKEGFKVRTKFSSLH